jgi:hypothetical protein
MSGPLNSGIPGMSAPAAGLQAAINITMTSRKIMMLPLYIHVFLISDI